MNLYTIAKNIHEFMNNVPEELGEDEAMKLADAFLELEGDFTEKIENTVKYIMTQNSYVDSLDNEIKRLTELKKYHKRNVERSKNLVDYAMTATHQDKLETSIAKISYRRSSGVHISDESLIPDEYKTEKVTVSPDKNAIKDALKGGKEVPGAVIEEKKNLQIK